VWFYALFHEYVSTQLDLICFPAPPLSCICTHCSQMSALPM
jgi:hypothetical protein